MDTEDLIRSEQVNRENRSKGRGMYEFVEGKE